MTMSRPMSNMLRTRRKDCNVKPNRRDSRLTRLDRKSSRGMLYENEELRLKTININAEVESREFDIKKLRRENEMLKKGIWYIRDEYDKLERLIKEKKIDFSSSSTTCTTSSSDTETSCSGSEESEEVETTQNLRNVQRTNMRNFQEQFDHLSVVTEENSADNTDLSSNRNSVPREGAWKTARDDDDVIPPDQGYPAYVGLSKSQTLPNNFHADYFSSVAASRSLDDNRFNQVQGAIYPGELYEDKFLNTEGAPGYHDNFQHEPGCEHYKTQKTVKTDATSIFQNIVLVPKMNEALPLSKSATDLIVKMDNRNFNDGLVFSNTPSHSTFSNGGNLEELLNDIESISQRGHNNIVGQHPIDGELTPTGQGEDPVFVQNGRLEGSIGGKGDSACEKPFKSELSVVLMPNPMPLIGVDKYKEIKRSIESINSRPIEEMSASQQNLCIIPPPPSLQMDPTKPSPVPPSTNPEHTPKITLDLVDTNPFFFGNFKDNYVNADYFSLRYNPDNFPTVKDNIAKETEKGEKKSCSKANLLDITSSEHLSSENEDKFNVEPPQCNGTSNQHQVMEQPKTNAKPPKMTLRKKVSIRFGGKKDKNRKSVCSSDPSTPLTPDDRKKSLFEKKDGKSRTGRQQTPGVESKKSTADTNNQEPKTPTSSDSKTSSSEKKTNGDKKTRKSQSLSPDRTKHVHMKEEGGRKHKKNKKSDRNRLRRGSILIDPRAIRERSFSVCTDRSNTLEHRLGLGLGFGSSFLFDDYSDGGRTNSMSSCEMNDYARKMSTMSNIPINGKVPWCGCWGNGCL